MELQGWEINLELKEAFLFGFDREVYADEFSECTEIDWTLHFMCLRLRLTLIYY